MKGEVSKRTGHHAYSEFSFDKRLSLLVPPFLWWQCLRVSDEELSPTNEDLWHHNMDLDNILSSIFSSDGRVVELIEADSKVVPHDPYRFPKVSDEMAR